GSGGGLRRRRLRPRHSRHAERNRNQQSCRNTHCDDPKFFGPRGCCEPSSERSCLTPYSLVRAAAPRRVAVTIDPVMCRRRLISGTVAYVSASAFAIAVFTRVWVGSTAEAKTSAI